VEDEQRRVEEACPGYVDGEPGQSRDQGGLCWLARAFALAPTEADTARETRRVTALRRHRELQRQRQMRVLVGMADEQGVILLRGMIVEWHSDVERTRRTRRVTALRRSQERQKATVERSVAVWASGQATIVEGSAFVSLRDVVLGVRQLRRHAERVFLVLREGDDGCCNGSSSNTGC
jgi:riboflavin synthase alpha subunit